MSGPGSNDRDLQGLLSRNLNHRRFSEADIKHPTYVGPFGDSGLHRVKNRAEGVSYIVSGPGATFRPGTEVPAGSNTGTQGETILVAPPPGRRGRTVPLIFERTTPPKPAITGSFNEFTHTSTALPKTCNGTITGVNFSPNNYVEIVFEGKQYSTEDCSPYNELGPADMQLISTAYISSEQWDFTVYFPFARNVAWQMRVRAVTGSGIAGTGDAYLTDDDCFDGRWTLTGV